MRTEWRVAFVVVYVLELASVAIAPWVIGSAVADSGARGVGGDLVAGLFVTAFVYPPATIVLILIFSTIDSQPQPPRWILLPLLGVVMTVPLAFMPFVDGSIALRSSGGQGIALLIYFILAAISASRVNSGGEPLSRRALLVVPLAVSLLIAAVFVIAVLGLLAIGR